MRSIILLGLLALSFAADSNAAESSVAHKISLSSRQIPRSSLRHRSRSLALKRRGISPETIPLMDFFSGTDLQWFGNVSVGNPPQELTVTFDTASFDLEIPSTRCGLPCANQVMFDDTQSSTFVDTGNDSTLPFDGGSGVNIGNDSVLSLHSGQDTVSYAGIIVDKVDFFLITNQTPDFAIDPFSGIQGMAPVPTGFMLGAIEQGLSALFSLYLTPDSVGGAELTFGGIDDTKFTGNISYVDIVPDFPEPEFQEWTLSSPQIFVNGQTNDVFANQRNIVVDSGTPSSTFTTVSTQAIYAAISPDIIPFGPPGAFGIECAKIPTLEANIDIQLQAIDGTIFNLTIPTNELSVGPFKMNASMCQTFVNAEDDLGFDIVGAVLLKHVYSVFDIENQRVGFAANGV